MLAIRARRQAERQAWRVGVQHAWLGAALQRAGKLPPLDELLGDDAEAAPRTPEEHLNYQLSALSRWSAISIAQHGMPDPPPPPPTTGARSP